MLRIQDLKIDGMTLLNVTPEEALAAGASVDAVNVAVDGLFIERAQADIQTIAARAFTGSAAQAQIYSTKYAEAKAYVAAGKPAKPAATDYPFLSAEAPVRGMTLAALADLVIATGDGWQMLAGQIEAARVKVAFDVKAATTIAAKQAAAQATVAALDAAVSAAIG